MSFVKVFHAARTRAIFAALALIMPISAMSATSASARDELSIYITTVTALDAADKWLAGPDDFYARVTIDGQVFTTKVKRQKNHASPNWRVTKFVRPGVHNIRLEIFDKDIGKADDKIDINRLDNKRDLDFTVDTRKCRIEGFAERYRCGEPIRRAGNERKKAAVEFVVSVR
jgi:hypothetical protein